MTFASYWLAVSKEGSVFFPFIWTPIEPVSSLKLLRNAYLPSIGIIITTFAAARSVRNSVLPSLLRIMGWANDAVFEELS